MITTRFLHTSEYGQYASWLKKLDSTTRQTYFGMACSDSQIDALVKKITDCAKEHNFLVAEYRGSWIGTVHIAESDIDEVEFGVIVDPNHRGRGIANRMMSEAIVWSRNRGYQSLYLHCVSWNQPIKHLCKKHNLELYTESGETDAKMPLPPADFSSITQEMITRNRNVYRMMLQRTIPFLEEVYG